MWQRLLSCADQAAATLLRTSFSTVVAASHDFRYAITDAERQLARPVVLRRGHVRDLVPGLREEHRGRDRPREIRPGDVYLTNDPWLAPGIYPTSTSRRRCSSAGGSSLFPAASSTSRISAGGSAHTTRPRCSRRGSASPLSGSMTRESSTPTSSRFCVRTSASLSWRKGTSRARWQRMPSARAARRVPRGVRSPRSRTALVDPPGASRRRCARGSPSCPTAASNTSRTRRRGSRQRTSSSTARSPSTATRCSSTIPDPRHRPASSASTASSTALAR